MTLIAVLVVIAVVAMLWQQRRPEAGPRSVESISSESELLRLCHGDAAKMRRLIALEKKVAPSIVRHVAIERAIDRLRRDHR